MANVILFEVVSKPTIFPVVPISLGYIAASLKENIENVFIKIISFGSSNSICELEKELSRIKPILIGFSTYQINIYSVLNLAAFIKKILPNVFIIIGGPQAIFLPPQSLLAMESIDFVCRSEGELVLPRLVENIKRNKDLELVQGILFKKNKKIIETSLPLLPQDLDIYPSPYLFNIYDLKNYQEAMVLSSRGCLYNCPFCYTPKAYNYTVRFHSIKRVISEMEMIIKGGIRKFWFADPTFTCFGRRTEDLMDEIIKKKWDISIFCETRLDLVTPYLLKKMKRAGVNRIGYGLETVNKKTLKMINKKMNLKQIASIIKLTQNIGIEPELFFIYGLPGESFEDALKTIEFVKKMGIKFRGNSNGRQLEIYFGTEFYENMMKYGIKPLLKKSPLFLSPGNLFKTVNMDKKDLNNIEAILNNLRELADKEYFDSLSFYYSSYI